MTRDDPPAQPGNGARPPSSAGRGAGGQDAGQSLPRPLRIAAAASWRFLVIVAAIGVLGWLLGRLSAVTVPVGVALLASALFAPLVNRLVRWHVPKGLATLLAIVVGLIVVGGVVTLVVTTVTANLPELQSEVSASLASITDWLQHGPLHLSHDQLQRLLDNAVAALKGNTSGLFSRAVTTATTVGATVTEALLALFSLIFFLLTGAQVWGFLLRIVPGDIRDRVDVAGRRGFASLVSYVRATVAVACVDAVCIGVGIWIVGVPLAVPLAALIFVGAFVPIIGAVVAGAAAVLVALVAKGIVAAAIVLGILVAVMQLESHILQPFLLGRIVRLHPLAIVLAIATGLEVAGIVGALLAVPILAVAKTSISSLLHDETMEPDLVDPLRTVNARPASRLTMRRRKASQSKPGS
jgi:putative heme transporter